MTGEEEINNYLRAKLLMLATANPKKSAICEMLIACVDLNSISSSILDVLMADSVDKQALEAKLNGLSDIVKALKEEEREL